VVFFLPGQVDGSGQRVIDRRGIDFDRSYLRGAGAVGRVGAETRAPFEFAAVADLCQRAGGEAVGGGGIDQETFGQGHLRVFEIGLPQAVGVFVLGLGQVEVEMKARGSIGEVGGRLRFDRRVKGRLLAIGGSRFFEACGCARRRLGPGLEAECIEQRALAGARQAQEGARSAFRGAGAFAPVRAGPPLGVVAGIPGVAPDRRSQRRRPQGLGHVCQVRGDPVVAV
jgi:hypothetical protein